MNGKRNELHYVHTKRKGQQTSLLSKNKSKPQFVQKKIGERATTYNCGALDGVIFELPPYFSHLSAKFFYR
jgi:hypothetical protein